MLVLRVRPSIFFYGSRPMPPSRLFHASTVVCCQAVKEPLMVVVGGGAAGVYAAIQAKSLAPRLGVLVVEKGKFLSRVRISGGGRCNVTNGHYVDKMVLAEHYPRGHKELRGAFFSTHGPLDTMSWFEERGVELKIESDGRVFPVSDDSSTIIDCLLREAKKNGVILQAGKSVTNVASSSTGKFIVKIEKRTIDAVDLIEADYVLIASGSSQMGYTIAKQLGHSITDPIPSLFTFKVQDPQLTELSGVSFEKVKIRLNLDNFNRVIRQFTQEGPMLVTHWGLSGPVVLRLSAWGARELFGSEYRGLILVDFVPDSSIDDVKVALIKHKDQFGGLCGDVFWASVSNSYLDSIATILKKCSFELTGKGQFKDEFVTAGGVPLSEVTLNTMESRIRPRLYFAGEILNVDGVTGGFNLQNAWSGGYIAGTSIGKHALEKILSRDDVCDDEFVGSE